MGKKYQLKVYYKDENKNNDNKPFPIPLRCIIIGSSGSGKTTLLTNFIYRNWLDYSKLYVCSKSLEQEVYQKMIELFSDVENKIDDNIALFYGDIEEMETVDNCEPNSLVVFDDCVLENQEIINEYFVRGRHKNISCIYLSQCYSKVDRQLIRNNVNFICVFQQPQHYTQMIYEDFTGSDFSKFDNFKKICNDCWQDDYGFISINTNNKLNNGKYIHKLEKNIS